MNFKDAIDAVCAPLGHEDVAKMLGVSVQTVRQARLSPNAKAFRQAPPGWENAALKLAEARAKHFERLADRLRATKG
jgi:hypothetical protein